MSQTNFPFAVWRTQDGGLVQRTGLYMVFVKEPNCEGFRQGDVMPEDWKTYPANDAARSFAESDEFYNRCNELPDFD